VSLHRATDPAGRPLGLPPGPVPAVDLVPWVGVPFDLPADDPWLVDRQTTGHTYLSAAARGWEEHPDWMDFLDLESPVYSLKMAERDLYLHHWRDHLGARRVLDLGCGIGRMAHPFLDRGATVYGVDGDLEGLRRFAWHAAGRPGRLELSWSSVHRLPDVGDLDVVLAVEVLCYVPEPGPVLAEIARRLVPGGHLLLSWEAPWGWAAAEDTPADSLVEALRGPGILHRPGERWVRTVSRAELEEWLVGAGLEVVSIAPSHWVLDGPLERCLDPDVTLEDLLAAERACAEHPVWAPLHRLWTATARRPAP
jgi:SAM-dependent methyltransferase